MDYLDFYPLTAYFQMVLEYLFQSEVLKKTLAEYTGSLRSQGISIVLLEKIASETIIEEISTKKVIFKSLSTEKMEFWGLMNPYSRFIGP